MELNQHAESIYKAAVLGTAQAPGAANEPELLRELARLTVARKAGGVPAKTDLPAPVAEAADPETSTFANPKLSGQLGALAYDHLHEVLGEGLALCAERGLTVLPEYAPLLLSAAESQKNAAFTRLVLQTIGKPGRRLAERKGMKAVSPGSIEDIWEETDNAGRVAMVRALKEASPDEKAAVRKLLFADFKAEPAQMKLRFLKALALDFGPDDLPFLEERFGERGAAVRRLAFCMACALRPDAEKTTFAQAANQLIQIKRNALGIASYVEFGAFTAEQEKAWKPLGWDEKTKESEKWLLLGAALPSDHIKTAFKSELKLVRRFKGTAFGYELIAGLLFGAALQGRYDDTMKLFIELNKDDKALNEIRSQFYYNDFLFNPIEIVPGNLKFSALGKDSTYLENPNLLGEILLGASGQIWNENTSRLALNLYEKTAKQLVLNYNTGNHIHFYADSDFRRLGDALAQWAYPSLLEAFSAFLTKMEEKNTEMPPLTNDRATIVLQRRRALHKHFTESS